MGTRCGTIDPSIVAYVVEQSGMSVAEVNDALNKKSGLLGVSGVSNDARYVWEAADQGNERAKLAMELLVHNAKKIIGSYVAEMNGVDVLIFTAGLGENDRKTREAIASDLDFLGITFDKAANDALTPGTPGVISTPDSKVAVLSIPTDEEFMIACDTEALVK